MQITNTLSRHSWIIDVVCLTITFSAFYTLWLGCHPLFIPDEGRYSEIAHEMLMSHNFITPKVNGIVFLDKPILYYWLQAAAMALFGVNEWALRLFPALFGVIGCLTTYICGRRLFDRRTALLAAIILAATPLYFGNAHYANLDLEVAVLISSSLLCWLTGVQSQDRTRSRFLYAGYVFAACAFLTKGLIGIVFPLAIGSIWIALIDFKLLTKIRLGTGTLLFSLIVIPWYYLVQQENPTFLHYFFVTQHFSRFLSTAVFNNPSPVWFYLPIVLAGFFPWTALLAQALYQSSMRVWRNRHTHATELFLLLWIAIVFIFFSIPHSKVVGYILPIFPALALLVANLVSHQWEQPQSSILKHTNIILATICLAATIALLIADHFALSELVTSIRPSIYLVVVLLIASAGAALCLPKQANLLPLFVLCTLTSATVLVSILSNANDLNRTSAKPLIQQLQALQQPGDEVVNYYKFYHDVPLFLGHPITLVADWNAHNIAKRDNWVRELWFGMPEQKQQENLITEATFWQRFHSDKRIFVFLNNNYFEQFKARASHYFIIGKHNDIILLSNKLGEKIADTTQ